MTHGGSQWGLQAGGDEEKPRLRSRLGKREEDSHNRRVSSIISKLQLVYPASSAFISKPAAHLFLRIFSKTPSRLETVCVYVFFCFFFTTTLVCNHFFVSLVQGDTSKQTELPFLWSENGEINSLLRTNLSGPFGLDQRLRGKRAEIPWTLLTPVLNVYSSRTIKAVCAWKCFACAGRPAGHPQNKMPLKNGRAVTYITSIDV